MTCKDCINFDGCTIGNENDETICNLFKDKSRFIELPCKVGDTVYKIIGDKRVKKPYECKVIGFWYSQDETCNNIHLVHYVKGVFESSFSVPFTEIGKTIFLTKEEAEVKLKELNADENEWKIRPLDIKDLTYLVSQVINRRNYKAGIVCDSVTDFVEIIKAIYDLGVFDKDWRYTNSFISNYNTGSIIKYIHNGDDTARAYRYHEIFYYNCEIDERFKEYVLLPILRPIEE